MEAPLVLLLCASVAIGWRVVRHAESPATWWVAGWVAAGAGSVLALVRDAFPLAQYLAFPLGSLFPALLFAGACVFARRRVPRWLLPGALIYGGLRAAVAAAGRPDLAWSAALVLETPAVLASAWLVQRAVPAYGASRSERLLAPSLVVLAAIGAVHVATSMQTTHIPASVLAMWVVSVPPLLGVQLYSEWERSRRALQRAHDELERRVEHRTAALRESEARYRVASELGSDLAFGIRIDRTSHFYEGWFSDAFPRLTGYGAEDLRAGVWHSIVHPDALAATRRQFVEILAGRARELETRLVTKDGRVLTVDVRIQVVEEPGGILHIVGAAHDVTEIRRAAEQRRELELRMLEAQRLERLAVLTGGVAHDFDNLLVVILGNSRAALAELPVGSPLFARLSRVCAAAEQGARLTEQMLAYSGKSALALKPIDLSQLALEMADLLRASVPERCRIALELAPHAPTEGDATQLQQVLLNLVTNAGEALADRRGRIAVRTGRSEIVAQAAGAEGAAPGRYAFLEVEDDGPGMDGATRQRIFEPFFTTKLSGRGLGLAAVQGIVRGHRGVVQVESEPGRGARLRVLLPLAAQVAEPQREAAPAASATARRGTVLVVDDHESVVEVAQHILESAGHRVLTAVGGSAGIARFAEHAHEIDAVLLDLTMPDADGEQVLDALQRVRPEVRVIIATGYGAGFAAERVRGRVTGFVHKPYDFEEMLAQIDRALEG